LRYRAWTVGIGASLAALGAASSCRQVAGIQDSPPIDLTTTACGLPYATTTCASCAAEKCCAESTACSADPLICSPYEACLGQCAGDPGCRSACTIDHPVPAGNAAPVSALSACLAAKCENECALPCGAFAGYLSEPDASAGCQSCIVRNSCDPARACGSSVDCDAYWRCYLSCPTADCQAACALAHDAGFGSFNPVYQAFQSTCATPCAYGDYWACAGKIVWPAAKTDSFAFHFQVIDYTSRAPIAGASVSVCSSCPCPQPNSPVLAQGQTDDAGSIRIDVPQVVSPMGIGLNGCNQVTAPGYVPEFAYWDFPISESIWADTDVPGLSRTVAIVGDPQLVTPMAQQEDTTALGMPQQPTRGQIGAEVFDCLGSLGGRGAQVTISSDDPLVSVSPSLGDAGADRRTGQTAAVNGRVFFQNVPPGSITLTATPLALGVPVSQVTVNVDAGAISAVRMYPTPKP
jgi:hypothetical protein